MPCGRPGGRQMPDPQAVIKFQMPHPRDLGVSKCPTNARGGGGGGWAPLELTDALVFLPVADYSQFCPLIIDTGYKMPIFHRNSY